ncbi:hypothetical protein [Blastomonas sp. AAP53]|uniref:hypothetical protein n=1 Tax=Blastomonas sp. AAP53 TaxID=1248760 RepID=UPI0002E6CB9F|nr:hypothetical protein [Blastomonas sp. AAP53]
MRLHHRWLAMWAALLPIAASAQPGPPPGEHRGPPGQSYANSSAVLVADIAFARLAQEKGQWTASRETAAPDAVTLTEGPVLAQSWLKDRADPPQAARWQAKRLFMACDGRTGAASGVLNFPDGQVGSYTSVWQNLEKPRAKKPKWRWVFNHGALIAATEGDGDMISSRTAVCTGDPKALLEGVQMGPLAKDARIAAPASSGARASTDGTMVWRWNVRADGSRTVSIDLWNGTEFETVVRDDVPAGAA